MKAQNSLNYFKCNLCLLHYAIDNNGKVELYEIPIEDNMLIGAEDFTLDYSCIVHKTDEEKINGGVRRKLFAHHYGFIPAREHSMKEYNKIYDKLLKLEKLKNFK